MYTHMCTHACIHIVSGIAELLPDPTCLWGLRTQVLIFKTGWEVGRRGDVKNVCNASGMYTEVTQAWVDKRVDACTQPAVLSHRTLHFDLRKGIFSNSNKGVKWASSSLSPEVRPGNMTQHKMDGAEENHRTREAATQTPDWKIDSDKQKNRSQKTGAGKGYLCASEECSELLQLSLPACVQIPVPTLTTCWLWSSCSNCKCLNCLICKMEIKILYLSQGLCMCGVCVLNKGIYVKK